MAHALAALILVAYLPGALIYRLPTRGRDRRAVLAAEERAFWAVVVSVALTLSVVLLLAALNQYSFERLLIILGIISIAVLVSARGRLPYRGAAARLKAVAAVPAALVALALWMFSPPSEYVIGGKDPGVYMNEGIQIAQSGSLTIREDVVGSIPGSTRRLFFPRHRSEHYYSPRFMGFFIVDVQRGETRGQFPHLFPASIAVGYGLYGLTGARYVTPFWAALGVAALYFAGARLLGPWIAAPAALLLAINVVEVWFARYPNAEVVMQALLLAAVLAYTRAHLDDLPFFAPLSGALIGLLLFLRYDALLGAVAIAAATGVGLLRRQPLRWSFWLVLAITLALGWWYLLGLMAQYADLPVTLTESLHPGWLALAAAVACATLALIARRERLAAPLVRWIPVAIAAVIVILAVYAFFFRQATGRTPPHDALALRTFGWYITPAGVWLAVLGFAVVTTTSFWRDPALLLNGAAFSLFVFHKIRIVPEHFWMARRFLAVILPSALLMIAAICLWPLVRGGSDDAPLQWRKLHYVWSAAGGAVLLVLGWHFVQATRPILSHVEYGGVIERIERLAARFTNNDLVILESRNSSDLHVLATPLAYIYDRPAVVFVAPRPNKTSMTEFLAWAGRKYQNVYFLGSSGTDIHGAHVTVEKLASERFSVPEYDSPRNAYPDRVRYKAFDFGVFRLHRSVAGPLSTTVDIGEPGDELYVLRFHPRERVSGHGRSFRWTTQRSYVTVVGIGPARPYVTLWLNNGNRPAHLAPAKATVTFENRLLGEVSPGVEFEPFTFEVPEDLARAIGATPHQSGLLGIQTNTWIPRAIYGGTDDRELGVVVDRVKVSSAPTGARERMPD